MPHSPDGHHLRAAEVADLPDSPVDLTSAPGIDTHRPAPSWCCTNCRYPTHIAAPLRLCAVVAFGALNLDAFPSSPIFKRKRSRYRA